jgi:hypothetical protein
MTESTKQAAAARNWADEIDDLHQDATVRNLREDWITRIRKRAVVPDGVDERVAGRGPAQPESSAAGIPQ